VKTPTLGAAYTAQIETVSDCVVAQSLGLHGLDLLHDSHLFRYDYQLAILVLEPEGRIRAVHSLVSLEVGLHRAGIFAGYIGLVFCKDCHEVTHRFPGAAAYFRFFHRIEGDLEFLQLLAVVDEILQIPGESGGVPHDQRFDIAFAQSSEHFLEGRAVGCLTAEAGILVDVNQLVPFLPGEFCDALALIVQRCPFLGLHVRTYPDISYCLFHGAFHS